MKYLVLILLVFCIKVNAETFHYGDLVEVKLPEFYDKNCSNLGYILAKSNAFGYYVQLTCVSQHQKQLIELWFNDDKVKIFKFREKK